MAEKARNVVYNVRFLSFEPGLDQNIFCGRRPGARVEVAKRT